MSTAAIPDSVVPRYYLNLLGTTVWVAQEVLSTVAIPSAITVKRLAVEREVKQKFPKIKEQIAFWKTEFSNATYDLSTILITKQPNKWLIKEKIT